MEQIILDAQEVKVENAEVENAEVAAQGVQLADVEEAPIAKEEEMFDAKKEEQKEKGVVNELNENVMKEQETKKVIVEAIKNLGIVKAPVMNLLFVEGNREKIDKSNTSETHKKLKAIGYIASMPIEYSPMEHAKTKLNGRRLLKPILKKDKGEGIAIPSNFKIEMEVVAEEDYCQYDGVCIDGQHRILALKFSDFEAHPTYQKAEIPEDMDILQYIALRNNGKAWRNADFYFSQIPTHNDYVDHIMSKRNEKYITAFLLNAYTLGTLTLMPKQIQAMQQGYKNMDDFKNVQLNPTTQKMGDAICQLCDEHNFLTTDKLTGRFGMALKTFYKENGSNFDKVMNVLETIDKTSWETYFTPKAGQSMETKAYYAAFQSVLANLEQA